MTDILHSRNGRPVGRLGEKTLNARRWAREIVESEWYHDLIVARLKAGTCPPAIEALILQYAWGRPKAHIDIDVTTRTDLHGMTTSELEARAVQLVQQLRAQQRPALPEVIDAEAEPIDTDDPDPTIN